MSQELEGQLPLFTLSDCGQDELAVYDYETCSDPECWCDPVEPDEPDEREDYCFGDDCGCKG